MMPSTSLPLNPSNFPPALAEALRKAFISQVHILPDGQGAKQAVRGRRARRNPVLSGGRR